MQISNNHSYNIYYPRGNSSRAENLKEQESPKTYGEILDEAIQKEKENGGNSVARNVSKIYIANLNTALLEGENLYGTLSFSNMKKVLAERNMEIDSNKIQNLLSNNIAFLQKQENNESRLDEFGNLSSLPQYIFEVEKSQAIDILSEILQGIKT
ncbi:hypothetical protein [Helicobacter ganmani]|uniref:hypothetical protein n=1 Tax=Helicobacter ganmani TaxID=60246 RepID=UPI003A86B802